MMLQREQELHPINIEKITDLRYRHNDLSALFQNMAQMRNPDLKELVQAGYYGSIIQEAWTKEGRI